MQRPLGVWAAVVVVVTAAACGSDGEGSAGPAPVDVEPGVDPVGTVIHETLTVADRERSYRLYVPETLPDGPVPLFVGLHGGGGWGDQFARTNHIEGLAEANGFVAVHPDGVEMGGGRPGATWNGGICCGAAARQDVDDVGFIDALVEALAADYDIDPNRVFAFGHSNGGIMSYRLACELADRIAGIGVVAGTLGVEDCSPSRPVSVIHIHGDADQNIPITGGVGAQSVAGNDFPSPLEGFAMLAELDDCPEPQETTGGDITTAVYEPCNDGTAAEMVTIADSPHAWPGGTSRVVPSSGAPFADYDATAALVEFLLSHPRP